ncbi:hypothetical protein [Cellulosimicrobium sp. Marseille-Q8652]
MTEDADASGQELAGDGTTAAPQEPTPVDPTTSPSDVMRAMGFDPAAVKSLVITPTGVVAVAADYPDPHVPEEA